MLPLMFLPYRRFFDFGGRSRRREFWSFWLFNVVVYVGLLALFGQQTAMVRPGMVSYETHLTGMWETVGDTFILINLIPFLAVSVRRLHDQDRSGWLMLLGLIPVLGWFALFVLCLLDGNPGENRYGPDPKKPWDAEVFR